ncbi:MAG TPA: cytochrome c oxidase accessory protein CcoG [Kiritimatiellia bacterium]|nr:cytochrome c oxidase accessory protein CcoG [Kiritimatiellia bacterium]
MTTSLPHTGREPSTGSSPEPRTPNSEPPSPAPLHQPDWSDFRDHIPTADREGRRLWIYPRKPNGRLTTARNIVNAILLLILFAGPFIRIDGLPLLQMDILNRKFVIFGQIFWPQDLFILAIAMVAGLIMIVLFTAVYGRLWCGWLCPQTVLMEGVFRKIEYWIEGDAYDQRQRDKAPWTVDKIARKTLKHAVFFSLSFIIGNWLLMYIIGSEAWVALVTDDPRHHVAGLTAMVLFSLLFYGIFARFREQACTFICPYGRFQSVLLDENSIVVAYDNKRGEKRAHFLRSQPLDQRQAEGKGDCVDCKLCVQVCPTGIDIRNGTQMECVNCTACIDACNGVMDRVGFPRGLIRYASEANIQKGERFRITPRLVIYTVVLLALTGLLAYLLVSRSDIETTLLRSPGTLYQTMPNGDIGNLYLMKVFNKTTHDVPMRLLVESHPAARLTIAGGDLLVPAEQMKQSAVIVQLPPDVLAGASTPMVIGVYSGDKRIGKLKTRFMGPGASQP